MEYDSKTKEEMTLEEFENIIELEGDSLDFTHCDFRCQLRRHLELKHWCAYILLTKDCKLHKCYLDESGIFNSSIPIEVHGGWTYDSLEGDIYKIGFDCAHWTDINSLSFKGFTSYLQQLKTLGPDSFRSGGEQSYKTKSFVVEQLKDACEQLQEYSISKLRLKKIEEIL